MIEIKNREIFGKVIAGAMAAISSKPGLNTWEQTRWVNALAKGVVLIEEQPEWLEYHADLNMLTVWNQKTNQVYNANGKCECRAFAQGQPCKHRAAKQLIHNYFAELESSAKAEDDAALDHPQHSYAEIDTTEKLPKWWNGEGTPSDDVDRYLDEQPERFDLSNAPYLKPDLGKKPVKVGSFRI